MLPIYYWVDIFAVSQQILNVVGAVSKHPDCQFSNVISAAQGTVLTLIPWAAPVSVSRVWCLFEVMRTLQQVRWAGIQRDRGLIIYPIYLTSTYPVHICNLTGQAALTHARP